MATDVTPLVSFTRKERRAGALFLDGFTSKEIAGALDIGWSTANHWLDMMCVKAQVNRSQLMRYFLQNPGCLTAEGAVFPPGLHKTPCSCGSPGCWGGVQLKEA
jgi:DNA-binding CsgD family transcriptional regulator